MPNWCQNTLTVVATPERIKEITEQAREGTLLNYICPMPEALRMTEKAFYADDEKQAKLDKKRAENIKEYGFPSWYEFALYHWGTKWDIGEASISNETETEVTMNFETAWSPPVEAYGQLSDMDGVESVIATWLETGNCYCGQYVDGMVDDVDIEEFDKEWIDDNIPPLVIAEYGAELDDYNDYLNE